MIHEGKVVLPVRFDRHGNQIIEGLPAGERPEEYVIEEATLEIREATGTNIVAVKGPEEAMRAIMREKDAWQDE